jgi:Vacuolar protein sorting-associated protein 62
MTGQERELLERYSPVIQYDSMEGYSADSVATMTDCATAKTPHGNVLDHAGSELAAVSPAAGEAKLDLAFLHGDRYPDPAGTAVGIDDYLDVVGKEYLAEAHAMHLRPGMANQIYGHVVTDREGHIWLQYWFFYYYNDKAMLGMGLHEGDWEMVQLRIGAGGVPDVTTYAQHKRGECCDWADVEKEGDAPVVYSARGSHASYYRRGNHATEVPVIGWDYNDAGGPRVRPTLNAIEDAEPSWVAWPGRWGSTRGRDFAGIELGDDSPTGPRRHGQWRDPLKFHEDAIAPRDLSRVVGADVETPPAPTVGARREGDHAVVSFSFAGAPPLKAVLVSLDGAGDKHAPTTRPFEPVPASGEVEFPLALEDRAYTARAGGVGENGVTGPAGEFELPAPGSSAPPAPAG